jgi:small subunit ribosomal protein S20
MAHHPSAEKRNRQRIKRTDRNRTLKSAVRRAVKVARAALVDKSSDAAELVRKAASALDRAASKGVIPVARAARLKARLATQAHKSQAG